MLTVATFALLRLVENVTANDATTASTTRRRRNPVNVSSSFSFSLLFFIHYCMRLELLYHWICRQGQIDYSFYDEVIWNREKSLQKDKKEINNFFFF